MKKFTLMLASVLAAGTASAAALNWGFSEDSLLYVKSTDGFANSYAGDTSGWQFCLVYLGSDTALDISKVSSDNVVHTFDFGFYEDGGDNFADPFRETFDTTQSPVTIAAGGNFGVAFFNGESYDYVYMTDGSGLGAAITGTVALADVSATAFPVSHDFSNGGNIAVVASVPEPGIACMALLGIGMMIKRRRA